MNKNGYSYSVDPDGWNKNMVVRILQNSKYIGDSQYPALIEYIDLEKAMALQQDKFTSKAMGEDKLPIIFKGWLELEMGM